MRDTGKLYVAEAMEQFSDPEDWTPLQRIRPCCDKAAVETRLATYLEKHGGARWRTYRVVCYKRVKVKAEQAGCT